MIEWIGILAGLLTTVCLIPQVIHVVRLRDTKGISLIMYLLYCMGIGLWLLYGILLHNFPITVSNLITLLLSLVILAMKLRLG